MPSAVVIITAITSGLGLALNCAMLALVLRRGRKNYHFLFAAILLVCAIWDTGILLSMIRNGFPQELMLYGYVVTYPCLFLPVLIYHFTGTYLRQVKLRTTIAFWVISGIVLVLVATGVIGKISQVYSYAWGNIFRPDSMFQVGFLGNLPFWFFCIFASIWFLYRARRQETSMLSRRHMTYIMMSFAAIGIAIVKTAVLFGVKWGFLLPLGMSLNDLSAAVIAIAIVKDRLLDITVVVQRGTLYSALAAVVIFVFSFSEHLVANYFGHLIGGHSTVMHLISIAIVIAVLMPVKHRLEHTVGRYFEQKRLQF